MRRKIKELLNKEEGFTLVELLAVIVILGIIVAIAVPAIGNVVGDSRTKATEAEAELVIDAAQLYDAAEPETEKKFPVSTSKLVEKGYLEKEPEHNQIGDVSRTGSEGAYVYTFAGYSSDGKAKGD